MDISNNYTSTPLTTPEQINGGCSGKGVEELKHWLAPWMNNAERFGYEVPMAVMEKQLDEQDRILARIKLPAFSLTTESALEDWVDVASETARQARLCVPLFQKAWANVADRQAVQYINRHSPPSTHEELVTLVAERFRHSRYIFSLEDEVNGGEKQSTVAGAELWLQHKLARYIRLCERKNRRVATSEHRIIEVLLRCFPEVVEKELRLRERSGNIETLMEKAMHIEEEFLRQYKGELPQPTMAFPAQQEEESPKKKRELEQGGPDQEMTSPSSGKDWKCPVCGGGHFGKNCIHRKARCFNCNQIGHISRVCPHVSIKDTKGRVQTLFERKPGSTALKQNVERSQGGQLVTAQDLLNKVTAGITKAQEAAAKRREKKRAASGKGQRKKIDHPVLEVNEEEVNEEDPKEEWEYFWDDFYTSICVCVEEGIATPSQVVKIKATIAGKKEMVIPDTGAARSICSASTAARLGLRKTKTTLCLRGLVGRTEGREAEPVDVMIGPRTEKVTFCIVEMLNSPTIIGVPDLAKFNIVVDPVLKQLVDRNSGGVVAMANVTSGEEDQLKIDSTPDDTVTDDQLMQNHKKDFDKRTQHLREKEKDGIWSIMLKHKKCWLRPRSGGVEADVPIRVEAAPFKDRLRPINEKMKKILDASIDDLLRVGSIRPSLSPWASNVVMVQKTNGAWRVCVDFREVNKRICADAYPIPLIMPALQQMAHHRLYSEVDLWWGFWNFRLSKQAAEITAFITHRGLFEWTILPFGLKISPGIFQRCIDALFADFSRDGVSCYLDNIVIYADDVSEMYRRFDLVLGRCVVSGLSVKVEKMHFMLTKMAVLGHEISLAGISASPRKVEAILKARRPENKDELRSFLGLVGFCRPYVPRFAEIAAPLTMLMKKNARFEWSSICDASFELLRHLVAEDVMLAAPNGYGPFLIFADASDTGIGAVLLQEQDEQTPVIEYASKKLSEAEQRWDIREREAFAIKWACDRFSDYIIGYKVYVYSDNQSLAWMGSCTKGKVCRWALFLQQFDVELYTLSGKKNLSADFLSRSVKPDDADDVLDTIAVPGVFFSQIDILTNPPRLPTAEELTEGYKNMPEEDLRHTTEGEDGLRYAIRGGQLFVPTNWRSDIIYWFHASRFGCHSGVQRTLRRMRRWVWWPGWTKDVMMFIKGCLVCARFSGAPRLRSTMGVLSKPLPLEFISIDFIGPFKVHNETYHIGVVIDHCSRFMCCRLYPHATTQNAINLFTDYWTPFLGYPAAVLSDRGSCFTAGEFRNFVTVEVGARLIYTSPYYPQGNAINEACHHMINKSIKALLACGHKDEFTSRFRDIMLVHNAIPAFATGVSPYFCLFGFEPVFPGWQKFRSDIPDKIRQTRRHEVRYRLILGAALAEYEGSPGGTEGIKPGDWVVYWLSTPERQANLPVDDFGRGPFKYGPTWSLPAKVITVRDKVVEVHELGEDGRPRCVPLTHLRLLPPQLPRPLAELNLKIIEATSPPRLAALMRARATGPTPPAGTTVEELVDRAFCPRKRPRTLPVPIIVPPQVSHQQPLSVASEGEVELSET